MKKLKIVLFIMLLGMLLIKGAPSAKGISNVGKTLILFKGDKDVNLEYDNYRLVSTNLDMDKTGEYLNIYKHKETGDIVNKTIYVVDKNNIGNDTTELIKKEKVISSNLSISYVTKGLVENSYFYVSSIPHKNSSIDGEDTFLTYTLDGKIIWETLLLEDRLVYVKDIIIDKDRIVVVSEAYFVPSLMDIYIDTFDFSGKRINIEFYSGTLIDNLGKFIVSDDAYYIVGTTESVKGTIGGARDSKDMYLLMVERASLKLIDAKYYNLPGNDECVGAVKIDEYLYLFQKYKSNIEEIKVIKTDLKGEIIKEKVVSYGKTVTSFLVDVYEENIYMIVKESITKDKTSLKIIDEDLNINSTELEIDSSSFLIKAYIQNNNLNLFYDTSINNKGIIKIMDLEKNQYIIDCNVNYNLSLLRYNGNTLFEIKDTSSYKIDISFLQIEKFNNLVIDNQNKSVVDGRIFINGNETLLNNDLSSIEYDESYFGNYPVFYYYEGKEADLCYSAIVQVLPSPSIISNSVHDTNLKLTFNGEGFLNNKPIDSGYVITEEGKYHLVIIGKNSSKAEYSFEVKKQSFEVPNIIKNEDINANDIFNNIRQDKIIEEELLTVDFDNQKEEKSTTVKTIWWPLFIPVSITSIAIILFMKGALV